MTVWEDPEELDARANHQAIKERKYQALQELERHNFIICCEKDVCRIIIDRIRSGVDDRLRKDRKDIDKEEGRQNKYLYCGASLSGLPSSKQHSIWTS